MNTDVSNHPAGAAEKKRLKTNDEAFFVEREQQEFEIAKEFHFRITPSFCGTAKAFMARAKWNYLKFENKTGINRNTFYLIRRGEYEHPDLETVLKICIGLGLKGYERDKLLKTTGDYDRATHKHFSYLYILNRYDIKSISDFNDKYLRLFPGNKPPLSNDGSL